jgi:hypothetical protein
MQGVGVWVCLGKKVGKGARWRKMERERSSPSE